MSYATRLAASSHSPLFIAEFDGDSVDASRFDTATGWGGSADAANIALDTTDAMEGAGSIGWDKTGTSSIGAFVTTSSLSSFDISRYAYVSVKLRCPTASSGVLDYCNIRLGQDASNHWIWVVPASYFSDGEWVTVRLSRNELETGWIYAVVGSPTVTGCVYIQFNFVGTTVAYTHAGARADALLGHPYRISTGKVTTPRADTLQGYMTVPSISPHRYDPTQGTLGSASANFRVVENSSNQALSDLTNYAMQGRGVTIYHGFRSDAETDTNYQPIFRGIVQNAEHQGNSWNYTVSDNLQRFRRPFMQDASSGSSVNITGNILTVFLKLALSTGNGNNNSTYDTLTATRGAGISRDLFDVDDIETVRDNFMNNDLCDFTFVDPERSLLDFFLKEVCLAFGVVPVVRGNGKLSVRAVESGVYPGSTITDLNNTNIITGYIPPFTLDNERIRNQVRVFFDWNTGTEVFDSDTGTTYQNTTSVAKYGLRELQVKSRGIVDADVAARVARRHYTYLGEGAPPVKVRGIVPLATEEQGNLVTLTMSRIVPDLVAGTYGISGKRGAVEVRGFNPAANGGGGEVELDVALTTYNSTGNYRLISGLSVDYDSATAAQQAVYCWIADGSDTLGAGSDPAHSIGP